MKTSSIANEYAIVLYEVCEELKIETEVLYDIKTMIKMHEEEVERVLSIPIVSKKQKKEIVDELVKVNVNQCVINLLKILIDNNQLKLFKEIMYAYQEIFQKKNDIQVVHIKVAKELDSNSFNQIHKSLEKRLNKFVVVLTTVDPTIIGGIKIEYNGKVIDNTVIRHLNEIKKF